MKQLETTAEVIGRIGFIGAGKVGVTFGQYFVRNGFTVSGYQSRHIESAKEAAELTKSKAYEDIEMLLKNSDTLFITVPDGQIKEVWDHMITLPKDLMGKTICHASGSLSSRIFSGMEQFQVDGYSIHPLFAISDKLNSYKELSKCLFTIEGKETPKRQALYDMLTLCGNEVEFMNASQKPLYHAAAVTVSNFVVGLSYLGSQMLMECGFSKENADKALLPMLLGNVQNIVNQGSVAALTGPVERNDVETIRKHLQSFQEISKAQTTIDQNLMSEVYKDLSKLLITIGEEKHNNCNYEELKEVLSE